MDTETGMGNLTNIKLNDALSQSQSCATCKKYKLWSCFYLARYGYDLEPDGWCMKWKANDK